MAWAWAEGTLRENARRQGRLVLVALETEDKPVSVVEKEMIAAEKAAAKSEKSAKTEPAGKEKSGDLDE